MRRATIYVGGGLALVIGGTIIGLVPGMEFPGISHLEPWQAVFLFVCPPGLAIALLMRTLREPVRTGLLPEVCGALPIRVVERFIGKRAAAYGPLIAGFSAFSLLWNGANAWIPGFFTRTYGWSSAVVGLRYGLVRLVFGTLGVIAGGALGSRLESPK